MKKKDVICNDQVSGAEGSQPPELFLKIQKVLADHHLWLESQKKEGKQANLSGWDLSGLCLAERDLREINFEGVDLAKANLSWTKLDGANLSGANLREADLTKSRLQGADLYQANLEKADLTAANLRKAKLQEANFQEADLLNTDFRDADLQEAKLAHSRNLLGWQLAGANLAAAELPATGERFEELCQVGEITKTTSTLLWTLLTGCLYACLTVATTTDASFYVSTAATLKLPIIDVNIPTWGFFIFAPVVLLGWYFYFLLNLQRLWETLITLPALFPDGMRLDQKASPWFITGLGCSYFRQLQNLKPAFIRIQKFLSLVLVWWIVPLTLIFIWIGYLKARFWLITLMQILAIVLAIFLGRRTWWVAKATLLGEAPRPRKRDLVLSISSMAVLLMLSTEVMYLVPPHLEEPLVKEYESSQNLAGIPYGLYAHYMYEKMKDEDNPESMDSKIAGLIERFLSHAFINLDYQEVSSKPKGIPEDRDEKGKALDEHGEYLEKVKGARLRYINLRHGHAQRVFLAKADLKNASLPGCYLGQADLREADLSRAYLFNAYLAAADLWKAKLPGTILKGANLTDAILIGADLKGADLTDANLRYVEFEEADLAKAKLNGANVQEADFRKAQGLTREQIKAAKCWPLAYYDAKLFDKLGLQEDHNQRLKNKNLSESVLKGVNLKGANLEGYNLVHANLTDANLTEANLTDAKFKGADLTDADLTKADLEDTDFDGAILGGTNLEGADLSKVKNLTREQLESTKGVDMEKLPAYLKNNCRRSNTMREQKLLL